MGLAHRDTTVIDYHCHVGSGRLRRLRISLQEVRTGDGSKCVETEADVDVAAVSTAACHAGQYDGRCKPARLGGQELSYLIVNYNISLGQAPLALD